MSGSVSTMKLLKTGQELEEEKLDHEMLAVYLFSEKSRSCTKVAPHVEEFVVHKDQKGIRFVRLDVDVSEEVAECLGVPQVPCFMFFKGDGKKKDKSKSKGKNKNKKEILKKDLIQGRVDIVTGESDLIVKCKRSVEKLTKSVVPLTSLQDFDVVKTVNDLLIIEFTSDWHPCPETDELLEKTSEIEQEIKFAKVLVDECEELAIEFKISALPSIVLVKKGIQLDKIQGEITMQTLNEAMDFLRI